jgi:acyl carrier protein
MDIINEWIESAENDDMESVRMSFIDLLPKNLPAEQIFEACSDAFFGEELAEVCAETALTIRADCRRNDFHNWDYDHLEFIIGLSNQFGFTIPRNLLNGLPEQLIILVDSGNVKRPDCPE